jgi:hypothetical protein
MPTVILAAWSTRSPGPVIRRAGYSLHVDRESMMRFVIDYQEKIKGPIAGLGRFQQGPAHAVVVDDALAAKVAEAGSLYYDEGNLSIEERMPAIFNVEERPPRNFIELCLAKKVSPEDVDDFVDHWHAVPQPGVELRDYLGMSPSEYVAFMKDADSLYKTLFDRMPALA